MHGGAGLWCTLQSGLSTRAVQSASKLDTQRWPVVSGRAYKLGKKRWSYNQVELIMHNDEDESQLQVVEAVQHSPPALTDAQKVCGVWRLTNAEKCAATASSVPCLGLQQDSHPMPNNYTCRQ